jgi:hypothetical protein
MKKMLALVTLCGLGAIAATPAMADQHHRGRDDSRYERRHDDRYSPRHSVREDRSVRRYDGRYDDGYRRYRPRYVESGRYCDDYRHYRGVHYHVSPRDYYRVDYPRDAYRLYGRSGIDATLVVTLPLF